MIDYVIRAFPGRTFPRLTVSRWIVPRPDISPTGYFPDILENTAKKR